MAGGCAVLLRLIIIINIIVRVHYNPDRNFARINGKCAKNSESRICENPTGKLIKVPVNCSAHHEDTGCVSFRRLCARG